MKKKLNKNITFDSLNGIDLFLSKEDQIILEIIERKKKGIDCTEAESAEIKGYLKELKLPEEQVLVAEIQELFPQEYGEFLNNDCKNF
jgi:hypothetical protein